MVAFDPATRRLAELVGYGTADYKDRFRVWESRDGWRKESDA